MRLGYFTMPLHPLHRDWRETLQEDREAIILADRLGFHDAFVGEHLTDACENVTNSMIFLATLIHDDEDDQARAPAPRNLSQMHPVLIAAHAAMFDHLAQGRFIFGVSPGALTSDAEALGMLDEDRNKIFAEAIDVILAIWEREPPYDIDFPDNRFKVATEDAVPRSNSASASWHKPFQKPRPEIVGTVVAPFSQGVDRDGRARLPSAVGELPAAASCLSPLGELCEGQGGRRARSRRRRTGASRARSSSPTTTRPRGATAATTPNSPYRFYCEQMRAKMMRGKRLHVIFKRAQGAAGRRR